MAQLQYASIFSNVLLELYEQELTCNDLYLSNPDIQIMNAKDIRIPKLTVGGYKDHTRGSAYNSGTYENDYETKTLDHDRDIEFIVDPMDFDETNGVVSAGNIHSRFERTQAIPELDCYTYSKIFAEAQRVGAKVTTDALTTANVLTDFDDNMQALEDAGVPLSRCIMYCTPAYKKLLKNAEGIQRTLDVSKGNGIDRRIHSIDDINKMVPVPSSRFKTAFDFTDGFKVDATGGQINYIIIDPECQVSRVKYPYINIFTPGSDSRTADNYLYQNRRYNGTFALDDLLLQGVIINYTPVA